MVDVHGNGVIVIVHIKTRYGRNIINRILSVYSKRNDFCENKIIGYVNNQISNGNLLDVSIKKAPIWFTTKGLQLPNVVQTIIDAKNSLTHDEQIVNTESSPKSDVEESIFDADVPMRHIDGSVRTCAEYKAEQDVIKTREPSPCLYY